MEFFEYLTVFTIFVILPSIILTNIRRIKEAQYKAGLGGDTKDGMRMSELQALIELAVEDATAPLRERIEMLEEERLLAPPPSSRLEIPDGDDSEVRQPVARTRQTA